MNFSSWLLVINLKQRTLCFAFVFLETSKHRNSFTSANERFFNSIGIRDISVRTISVDGIGLLIEN